MSNYTWRYGNTLDKFSVDSSKGVYLLIFNGNPKRVIYVGTTNSFSRRMFQHKAAYLNGRRTIWKISNSEDIYELMSCQGKSSKLVRYKYYYSLAKKGKLWAHTTLEKDTVINDLNPLDDFENNWKDYTYNFFIKNIEVWTCEMNDDLERIIALESKIQKTLKSHFKIWSHIHKDGMSFLGKIEFLDDLSKFEYKFLNFPDLDDNTIKLFKNLDTKDSLKYKKLKSKIKEEIKAKKVEQVRITYKHAYTKWLDIEHDILFTCCNLNIEITEIARKYLFRTPEEIKKKIKMLNRKGKGPFPDFYT